MGSNFLRPLVTPEAANLLIVAVHGLNPLSKENHAYDTWTADGKLWLRDFLPEELPHARVLIFGYNANAVFDNSTAGVTDIAGNLLNLLKLRRDDCQTRPIIFIAHSLGGIIVKKALVDAQANVAYQSLDEATLGIVFFGTPHNGSDHAKLGNVAANIAKSLLRSPTSSLIESLKKNSFFADELRKQFRQKLMHYWVLSFYETLPSGKIGVLRRCCDYSSAVNMSINQVLSLKVPVMDEVEAEKLVQDKLKHLDSKQVEVHLLINLLGYLPLALVQAVAFIHKTSINIQKYINLYNKDKRTQMRLLDEDFSDLERDHNAENAVLKTWILSFEQIRSETPQAASLLSYMSFLDAQNIPESLLEVMIPDSLGLVKSLATLKAFALVTSSEDNETYDMHRMIQSSMQRWLETSQESTAWADGALEMLQIAYGKYPSNMWDYKLDEYYPHTIAALASNPGTTRESRESRATLWEVAGLTLTLSFQTDKAHDCFKRAIKLNTDLLGDAHPITLATMVAASRNLYRSRDRDSHYMQEAKALLLRAIHGFETAVGPQAEKTMSAKIFLAQIYNDSKDWTKAKEILTFILRQSKHTSWCQEKTAKIIIDSKQEMARIHRMERDFEAAETLQLEVVASCDRAFTRESMRTQSALDGLASIYFESGKLDKAKILFEEIIQTDRRVRGKTRPMMIPFIQNLAKVYCKLECYEDSLRILEGLLPLVQETFDYDYSSRISIIEQTASSLEGLHRYDEEVERREQVLTMRRQIQGFDHVETLASAVRTADCYFRLGRYHDALDLGKESMSISKRVLGDEHPQTLAIMFDQMAMLVRVDQREVGMALYQELFLLRQRLLSDDHVDTREARELLDCFVIVKR